MLVSTLLLFTLRTGSVTMSIPATRVPDAVKVLAEQVGETLQVDRTLENKYVVLVFKDTPKEAALKRVADCLGANWTDVRGIKTLTLPASAVDANATWKNAVSSYLKEANQQKPWTSKDASDLVQKGLDLAGSPQEDQGFWEKVSRLENSAPSKRLLQRIALSIGQKSLETIGVDQRVVYSSNPTRAQSALPPQALSAIKAYYDELRLKDEALQAKGVTEDSPRENNYYVSFLYPSGFQDPTVKKVLFSVKRTNDGGNITIKIFGNSYPRTENDYIGQFERDTEETPAQKQISIEGDFVPSKFSLSLSKVVKKSMPGATAQSDASPEDFQRVLDMFSELDKKDLLQYLPTEMLTQVATSLKKDLAAEVNDTMLIMGSFLLTDKLKLQDFFGASSSRMNFWWLEEDALGVTLKVDPRMSPFFVAAPRVAVAKFVRTTVRSGVSIDGVADLVSSLPRGPQSQIGLIFACLPFPGLVNRIGIGTNDSALRIYAQLPSAARQVAKSGMFESKLAMLPPKARQEFDRLVFVSEGEFANFSSGNGVEEVVQTGLQPEQDPTQDTDPTTIFPEGLPPGAQVTISLKTIQSLFAVRTYQGGYASTNAVSEESLANQMAWDEKAGNHSNGVSAVYANGTYEELKVGLLLRKDKTASTAYRLNPFFKDGEAGGLEKLPEAQRKSIQEKLAKARESLKDVQYTGGQPPTRIKP